MRRLVLGVLALGACEGPSVEAGLPEGAPQADRVAVWAGQRVDLSRTPVHRPRICTITSTSDDGDMRVEVWARDRDGRPISYRETSDGRERRWWWERHVLPDGRTEGIRILGTWGHFEGALQVAVAGQERVVDGRLVYASDGTGTSVREYTYDADGELASSFDDGLEYRERCTYRPGGLPDACSWSGYGGQSGYTVHLWAEDGRYLGGDRGDLESGSSTRWVRHHASGWPEQGQSESGTSDGGHRSSEETWTYDDEGWPLSRSVDGVLRTTWDASEHGPTAEIRWNTDASGLLVGEIYAEWSYDEAGRLTSFADHLDEPGWEERRTYVWDDRDAIREWTYEDRYRAWQSTQEGDCPPTDPDRAVPWLWPQPRPVALPLPWGEEAPR